MSDDEIYHDDKNDLELGLSESEEVETTHLGERRSSVLRQVWDPQVLPKPEIDPELHQLDWPERCAEVLRYTLLELEHWLSHKGILREWIRLNLYLAVILSVGALMVIPPLTAVMEGVSDFSILLDSIVENIMNAALKLPPVVIGLATLFLLVYCLIRFWRIRRGRGRRHLQRNLDYDEYH